MKNIKFSIIIATYNAGKTLETAIQSVLRQSYLNWELIIIDGGSQDDTVQIIKKHSEHIFYWVSEKDSGIYNAWNKGIALFTGEYVCFLGADDAFLPHALESYAACAEKGDYELITSQGRLVFPNGEMKDVGMSWEWPRFRRNMCFTHVGAAHRRSLFGRLGKFDESYKIAGDYEFFLRAHDSLKSAHIAQVLCLEGTEGVSTNSKVFYEACRAKLYHRSVSRLIGLVDLSIALFKYHIKKI